MKVFQKVLVYVEKKGKSMQTIVCFRIIPLKYSILIYNKKLMLYYRSWI